MPETSPKRAANPQDPSIWRSESGATSSSRKPEYRLIPFCLIRRTGQRLADGARKHGEGNWEKALDDRDFMMDRANHLIEHAYRAIEKLQKGMFVDLDDDDLGGVAANLAFLIAYQEFQIQKSTQTQKTLSAESTIRCSKCNHRHYYRTQHKSIDEPPLGICRECNCEQPEYASPD